jgi:hypothetical protein
MKVGKDLTEKLQPLIEKYAEVSEAIKRHKEKLLGILVRLAWLAGARTYDTYVGGYKYGIKSPTRIEVYTVPAMSRSYNIAEFVDNNALKYNDFCEWIIRQLAEFLRYTPHQHANTLEAISKLVGELTTLMETKGSK